MNEKYYKEAETWSYEIYDKLRKSRKLAWIITGSFFILTLLSLLAVILVLPLKEFSPYVIKVDKSTG
jgi:type IV secretion system protein VirB8